MLHRFGLSLMVSLAHASTTATVAFDPILKLQMLSSIRRNGKPVEKINPLSSPTLFLVTPPCLTGTVYCDLSASSQDVLIINFTQVFRHSIVDSDFLTTIFTSISTTDILLQQRIVQERITNVK